MASASIPALAEFDSPLHGCRFCPMCKPASDVANVSANEAYSTRARAMFLWRQLHGFSTYTPRYVELLYQSTLDSISEAWCVSHFPVSQYHLAARREVVAAGLAPAPVNAALARPQLAARRGSGPTLILAGEVAELADSAAFETLANLAAKAREGTAVWAANSGHMAHVLGDAPAARHAARTLAADLNAAGVTTIVADGAATLFALRKLLPAEGAPLSPAIQVLSLAAWLGQQPRPASPGGNAFVHDARAAYALADRVPTSEVIKPEFTGPEDQLGTGALFDEPRRLARDLGFTPVFSVWQRGLAKSSGADDGLWLTYPTLAALLAAQRLGHARSIAADTIVTESPLAAAWLRQHRAAVPDAPAVVWLPELWSAPPAGSMSAARS